MSTLVFQNGEFTLLRRALLSSPLETAAILLARAIRFDSEWRLLVLESITVQPEGYAKRGEDHIELSPEFLAPLVKRARHEQLSIVLCHTHPFPGRVVPSTTDRDGEAALLPTLFRRVPNLPHGRLIIGPDGHSAALFTNESAPEAPLEIVDVGRDVVFFERRHFSPPEQPRFDRQILAFGPDGQQLLRTVRVALIGLGGTGSVVAQQLAYLGVRKYLFIDPDHVDASNLNRLVGASPSDVGRLKVAVAKDAVVRIHPDADVATAVASALHHDIVRPLLDRVDFVFCCTDSHGSRAVINQFAYQYWLPVIDMGVVIDARGGRVERMSGRIQMLAPGLPCLTCQNLLDPEEVRRDLLSDDERKMDPYISGDVVHQPAVVSLNSTVASLGVTMFLSATVGIPLKTRHQIVRFETGVVRAVSDEQAPNCVTCSPAGAFGRGDSWTRPGRL